MRGAFPGPMSWLWVVLTMIIGAMIIFWVFGQIGYVEFPDLFA